jgi:hypothetical protein
MLQLLTIVLAIAFSLSNEPPQTALRDQDRPAVTATDEWTPPLPKNTHDDLVPPLPR